MKLHEVRARGFHLFALLVLAILCSGFGVLPSARAADPELVAVNVLVKDAASEKPVAFARLTLQYQEESSKFKFKKGKTVSLSAKTNLQGRYKFVNIPKGTIRLMVIAEKKQTFGQEIEVQEENQLIEVKLRNPQPLL